MSPSSPLPPQQGPLIGPLHRFRLGDFELTTILAGSRVIPDPHATFGTNVDAETFARVSAAGHLPTDRSRYYFTPTLLHTGTELVLFDTGLAAGPVHAALALAGYSPSDIGTVILTHLHGDHIAGLVTDEGAPAYPRARILAGAAELDHWTQTGGEAFERAIRPFLGDIARLADGDSPVPGVTALLTAGHSPGHLAFLLDSAGQRLMITGDIANHYLWSLGHPEWEVRFDFDKAQAIATRRRILSWIAAEGIPFIGYHMPFPALGYVAAQGEGFRYIPATYQLQAE